MGAAATGGGARRLPQRLSWHLAMELLLTGKRIDAAEAARLGLVNEVVGPGQALEAARRYADAMLACAPLSLQATKRIALASLESEAREVQHLAAELNEQLKRTDDNREGVDAFVAKRPPRWRGR